MAENNSRPRRARWWAFRIAVLVGVAALLLLARLADRGSWSPNRPPAATSPLVGTWLGEKENQLRLLSDGTIDGHSASWRVSGSKLSVIYDSPNSLSLAVSWKRMVFPDEHTDQYQFQLDGDSRLLLTDLNSGELQIFTRQNSEFSDVQTGN